MTTIAKNRRFTGLAEVLRMSVPASTSMLSKTLTQFVDALMVAQLGPAAISAQGIAAVMAFVPESFTLGTLGVVNTFVSQNLGAGRLRRCGSYAWAGQTIALLMAILIVPMVFFARPLFAAIGHEANVQAFEILYFRYMILAIPLTVCTRVLETFFYGIHRPGIVVAGAIIANVFNVLGNYALIFGHFGFPAMGLEGAAIASVASFGLHLTVLASVFLSTGFHRRYGTRLVGAMRVRQCIDILRIGWPAGVTFLIDILIWSLFAAKMIGRFGTENLNASTAAVRYMHLSFLPAVGISIATTALVGKYIGEGRPDLARKRAHTALRVAMIYMGTCALAFLVFRHEMVRLFVHVSPKLAADGMDAERIVAIGGRIMVCAAMFQIFDAMAIVFNGALRGAGDTRWPMVISTVLCMVFLGGGSLLMVHAAPELEGLGPYIAATAYIIALGLAMAWRFESGAWRRINLLGPRPVAMAPPVETAPITPGEMATPGELPSPHESNDTKAD